MTRTITVMDDTSGVAARITLDVGADGAPRISSILLTSPEPAGLTSADLLLLESVGLSLPASSRAAPSSTPAGPKLATGTPLTPLPVALRLPRQGTPENRTPEVAESDGLDARRAAGTNTAAKRAGTTDKHGRPYRLAPNIDELKRLIREHHGSPKAIATALGADVRPDAVSGWIHRARKRGELT